MHLSRENNLHRIGQDYSPLHYAALYGHLEALDVLINEAAEVLPSCEDEEDEGLGAGSSHNDSPSKISPINGFVNRVGSTNVLL